MGYNKVEVCEAPQTLIDYHGQPRPQKATVIVRREYIGSAANDIGFVKNAEGFYTAIVSEYDSHRHNEKWMIGLKKAYAEHGLIKQATRQGLIFLGKTIDKTTQKPQLQFAVRG